MTNQGAWTNTPTGSGKVIIPAGYHNGSGYVDTATVYTNAYNKGVTDADARANASSVNYQTGYNAGVAAADGRANTSSVNYQTGYNAGYAVGIATPTKFKAFYALMTRSDFDLGSRFTLYTDKYTKLTLETTAIGSSGKEYHGMKFTYSNGTTTTHTFDITGTTTYDIADVSQIYFYCKDTLGWCFYVTLE